MLTFAKLGNELIIATKESGINMVNILLGCVSKPLNLRNKNGDNFYADKSYCSHLLKGERDVIKEIQRGSGSEIVIENAEKYFSDEVVDLIIPSLLDDFLENMKTSISCDTTIAYSKKKKLINLAQKNTLAKFLSEVFLYVINKSNCIKFEITVKNNLPAQNTYFCGRFEQIDEIEKSFMVDKVGAVSICQTISGLGGVGKTQLSIEYAYRFINRYKTCVWFVNAESSESTYNYFLDFADRFNLILPLNFTAEDLKREVRKWLSENRSWLLILDNIETMDTVEEYLPQTIKGNILITTRNKRINYGRPFGLDVFSDEEAVNFLKRRLSNDSNLKLEHYYYSDFEENGSILASRLGALPLALEQAAAYIREVRCSIKEYLKLMEQSGINAFDDSYASPKYYEHLVTTTWNISFNALDESSRQLMNLCAYMAPDRIPVEFFVKSRNKLPMPLKKDLSQIITTNRIITGLRTYSLASGNSEFINIHRLVQEVVRNSHKD
ncbi:MAG: NB-ARC domain-containing protein [Hominimerdicola sp.]